MEAKPEGTPEGTPGGRWNWVVRVGEWAVLLPVWRRFIKSQGWRVAAASGVGLVWFLIIVGIASGGGGDDKKDSAGSATNTPKASASASPTSKSTATVAPTAAASTLAPTQKPTAVPTSAPTPEPTPAMTSGQKEAVESAKSYLRFSSFSRQGLIDQLLYEGFTPDEAEYGVNAAY